MLTSILDDFTESNGPIDSKRKTNINRDNNINNNKNYNNNNNFQRKVYENDANDNDNDNDNENPIKKIQKDTYNNNANNGNIYNKYSNNDNNNNYYINNYKTEPNSKSPYSIKRNHKSNNNINEISNNNDNNTIDDYKISQISNRPKKGNFSNNNINTENNLTYNNNKYDKYDNYEHINNKGKKSINAIKYEKANNNKPLILNNNNDNPNINYEIKDYKNENLMKNEYYIKYVTYNRQGYEFIHDRNYLSGLIIFQKCYDLSKNYLKDELKEINSLINISICQYYNGNFTESYTVINKAKIIYDSISLGGHSLSPKQKLQLALKLFINSSLANLSINNYNESKNDIKFLISTIRKESDIDKQFLYFRTILFTLFKVESLINYDIRNNNLNNSYNEVEISEPIKIINHLMNDFLRFLKEKNFNILLNTFKEAAQKYKKLNDFNGYYFSLFYHYLTLYNQKVNNNEINELDDIKKKISICNNNLIGNELINQIKEKDINKLLKEFVDKINCSCEIYQLLENFEKELNNKLEEYNKEKNNMNLSEDENNLSSSHLLDKSHLFTNEKINSPIFVDLLLKYSIKFLEKQKMDSIQNQNNNKDNLSSDNYDLLINEIRIMQEKIKSNEINVENIRLQQLDKEMINSLKQLFDNLIYIYYKSKLYKYFKIFSNKTRKEKKNQYINKIVDFLLNNSEELLNGLDLIKINYKTKGYKSHFYNINAKNLTFNIRKSSYDNAPTKSYSIKNDIVRVLYGIKSRNLRKKLLSKDKDTESIKLLRFPFRFLSIITKSRSIDLYCEDEQLDLMFYGLKYFFINNRMPYKINSTNYFVLNKIKLKLALKLKKKYKIGEEENEDENSPKILKQLIKEKAIQNISFVKLFLLFNKYK